MAVCEVQHEQKKKADCKQISSVLLEEGIEISCKAKHGSEKAMSQLDSY